MSYLAFTVYYYNKQPLYIRHQDKSFFGPSNSSPTYITNALIPKPRNNYLGHIHSLSSLTQIELGKEVSNLRGTNIGGRNIYL